MLSLFSPHAFLRKKFLWLTVSSLNWLRTVLRRARIRDRYILQRKKTKDKVFRRAFKVVREIRVTNTVTDK